MKGMMIGGFFALLLGLGMLTGAYFLAQNTMEFKASAVSTEGTVVDFSEHRSDGKTMYSPIVEFVAENGETISITSSSSSSSPGYDRGDKVKVLYKKGTPENARIDSFMENWFGSLILGIIGLVAALVGAGLFSSGLRTMKARKWLAQHGTKVQANLQGSEINQSIAVNNKHPWRIRAQWQHPVTRKVHIFYSDNIWFDPAPYLTQQTIDVLVDVDDPKRFQMIVDFLPEKG